MVLSRSGYACEASSQLGPNYLSSVRIRQAFAQEASIKRVKLVDLHRIDGNPGSRRLANP
jgi:hypothetical protein